MKYNEAVEKKTDDIELKQKLFCNRALVNIMLKNYGRAIEDADSALKLNSLYIRAWYRKATALLELGKIPESLTTCEEGLKIDKKNKDLIYVKKKVLSKLKLIEEKEKKKLMIKKYNLEKIFITLNKHNILYSFTPTLQIPPIYEKVFKVEDNLILTSIVCIYPEFKQFDFIQISKESDNV